MKRSIFALVTALTLVVALLGFAQPVEAAAYGAQFVTSITYQNVGATDATIQIAFQAEADAAQITINRPLLAAGAGTSVYLGSLSQVGAGFNGSAVMSSSEPLAVTVVQIGATGSGVKNRALYTGFSEGASFVLIPTVLKNTFDFTSVFSVQNVDSVAVDLKVELVPVSGSTIVVNVANLPSGASKTFDMGTLTDVTAASFNGSAKITATKSGTTDPGMVAATAMEMATKTYDVYAFEGTSATGSKIYMPTALCKFNGVNNSYFAVQNTSDADVDVTVNYSNGNADGPYTLTPGAKKSFQGCGVSGVLNPAGFIGSAVIEATGGNIVAMGKVTGGGLSTAFVGFTAGAEKIALPYVRWTTAHWTDGTRQRAYIAIQNVGDTDLAAGDVTVHYMDKNGVEVGVDTLGAIAAGAKANSNAGKIGTAGAEFGVYADGSYGGSAIVEGPAGSQLAVVVRVQTYIGGGNSVGEDYNGVVIQ